jgi:thiosulfate reductase cytochrome b subunit
LHVRITHSANALAILIMTGSGWQIYNAAPLFAFTFPKGMTLGGWLAGGLLWHFAAMWLLVGNAVVYVTYGLVTGRLRRTLLPIRPGEVARDLAAALSGRLRYDDPSRYNAVQKLLYAGVLLTGVVIVASGLALWKPVQLGGLAVLLGGYESARRVHFFAMAVIVAFLAVHITMALLVPKRLRAMFSGR